MKRCTKCKKNKQIEDFVKQAISPDGLNYWCSDCRREHWRRWYSISANNKAHIKSVRVWEKEHWDYFVKKTKKYMRNYYFTVTKPKRKLVLL